MRRTGRRRFHHTRAILVVIGMLALLDVGAVSAPVAAAEPPTCGGEAMPKATGGYWRCTFDDEFDGTKLDTSKWLPQETANSNYHSGMECFVNSPNNISVANGFLNLTVRKEAKGFVCGGLSPYPTSYTSGMVTTWDRFAQAYGRFEVRAKLPAATIQGLQTSFWLYPRELKYGRWPASGEIDFAEWFSLKPDQVTPNIHYNDRNDPNTTNDCVIGDAAQLHTYAVEWTTTELTVIVDGQTCLVDPWTPMGNTRKPQPFDQPFIVSLTQALGMGMNMSLPKTPLPATTQVDYVRVWA